MKKIVSEGRQNFELFYDATLQHLKEPYQACWVNTAYGKTHVLVAGAANAEPVLVLHGSASNAAGCWPLINGLAARYRVVAPDAPRQLGKTEPFHLSTQNADYGRWLDEVLNHFDIGPVRVVGFSFGGWVACKFSAYSPERVENLVLLSPIGISPFRLRYWLQAPVLMLVMLVSQTNASIRRFAALLAGPTASAPIIEEMTAAAAVFLKRFYMQAIPYRLKSKDLQKLAEPVMLMMGRHDTFCDPDRVARRLQGIWRELQVKIIEDAGHVIYFEKSEWVNSQILVFFDVH